MFRPLNSRVVIILGLCAIAKLAFAAADEVIPSAPLLTVKWDQLKAEGKLKSGEIVAEGNGSWLKIVNEAQGPQKVPLCELISPPVKTPSYAVRGKIRYQSVTGIGFLEMWNHFDGDAQYFSRTLGTDGPMQMVTGTSPEREFLLPFHTLGKAGAPKKLELNLVLNGPGTVEIGPLELVEIPAMAAGAWWSGSTGGLIGGIGGSIIGILGGVVGTLVGIGRGKRIVMALAGTMAILGVAVFLTGIVSVINGQPFEVYYIMLMIGGMTAFFGGLTMAIAPGRFRASELRRMQAIDSV